jgi:hypothetical protein
MEKKLTISGYGIFIMSIEKLIDFLKTKFAINDILNFGGLSCESIAQFLLENIPELYKVEVWEDWENGAVVETSFNLM